MKLFLHQAFLRRIASALCCLVLLSTVVAQQPAPSTGTTLSADEQSLANAIKTETIKTITADLAADDMQGRGTMQPGGDKAAAYIADRFAKLGLKPLGNKDTYLQTVKFRETRILPDARITVGDDVLNLGRDFYLTPPFTGNKKASGDLVFVAYGLDSTRPKRDDTAGIDLAGKMIVLLNGPPKNVSPEAWKKGQIQSGIFRKLTPSHSGSRTPASVPIRAANTSRFRKLNWTECPPSMCFAISRAVVRGMRCSITTINSVRSSILSRGVRSCKMRGVGKTPASAACPCPSFMWL